MKTAETSIMRALEVLLLSLLGGISLVAGCLFNGWGWLVIITSAVLSEQVWPINDSGWGLIFWLFLIGFVSTFVWHIINAVVDTKWYMQNRVRLVCSGSKNWTTQPLILVTVRRQYVAGLFYTRRFTDVRPP